MNILILNWKDIKNPEVGGAEVIAFEFARRLVKQGHQVTFFARHFPHAKKQEICDGVTIVRRGNKLSVYIKAFFYYRSLSKKPDLVIDMVNTLCWQTPVYVPRNKRIAYVNQLAKEVLFYELRWPLSYIAYFLERFEYIFYKNTKFLCYSKSTQQDLLTFGIPKTNVSLFPLGLDHTRYVPGGRKSKDPLFIFVARLVRMKRADLCIEAMKYVVNQFPKAKLYIIGNGPEEGTLEEKVKKLYLEKNIYFVNKDNFFIDKHTKDSKVKYMQQAWAILLPSVKEGWGMVVTEAAACGTPAIVSNVTGLRDSVIHKKTGFVLSANPSPSEMANAMKKLIKDKKLRTFMSKQAIAWGKNFNWNTSFETFKNTVVRV